MENRFNNDENSLKIFIVLFLMKKEGLVQKRVCKGIVSESHFSNILSKKYDFDDRSYLLILSQIGAPKSFQNKDQLKIFFEDFFISNILEAIELFSLNQFETAVGKLNYINFDIFYSLFHRIEHLFKKDEKKSIYSIHILKSLYKEELRWIDCKRTLFQYHIFDFVEPIYKVMLGCGLIGRHDNMKRIRFSSKKERLLPIYFHLKKSDYSETLKLIEKLEIENEVGNTVLVVKAFCLLELKDIDSVRMVLNQINKKIQNNLLHCMYLVCVAECNLLSNDLQYEGLLKEAFKFSTDRNIFFLRNVVGRILGEYYYEKRQYKKSAEYLLLVDNSIDFCQERLVVETKVSNDNSEIFRVF